VRLREVQWAFNRAAAHVFSKNKLFLVFSCLAIIGMIVLFFRAAAAETSKVAALGLLFVPFFLSLGLLFSLGILVCRLYHDEVKQRELSLKRIFIQSWDLMVAASYFSLPLFIGYLLLWFSLALFALMQALPLIGPLVSVFLSFAPFLINLALLLMILASTLALFFLTPLVAFRGIHREKIAYALMERLEKDLFMNSLLGLLAFLPLLFTLLFLGLAAWMTAQFCLSCESVEAAFLSGLFILVPFAALLSPAVIFFFNFSCESHLLMMREESLSP
jgi:hypothetical protein